VTGSWWPPPISAVPCETVRSSRWQPRSTAVPWSVGHDDGRETLFFPGPDAHVSHQELHEPEPPAAAQTAGSSGARAATPHEHVKNSRVDLYLFEQDAATMAHAVLHTDAPTALDSRGETHRNPSDLDVPEVGDEVAAARALRRLADRLLGVASDDIEAIEGHEVHLRRDGLMGLRPPANRLAPLGVSGKMGYRRVFGVAAPSSLASRG
jgi:hypothetical protein